MRSFHRLLIPEPIRLFISTLFSNQLLLFGSLLLRNQNKREQPYNQIEKTSIVLLKKMNILLVTLQWGHKIQREEQRASIIKYSVEHLEHEIGLLE